MGNSHLDADKSFGWDDAFPNLSDPDVVIVDLTTLTNSALERLDKQKLDDAKESLANKFLSGGIIIIITMPYVQVSQGVRAYSNYHVLPVELSTKNVTPGSRIMPDKNHHYKAYLKAIQRFSFQIEDYSPRIHLREGRHPRLNQVLGQKVEDNARHMLGVTLTMDQVELRRDMRSIPCSGKLVFLPPPTEPMYDALGKIMAVYGKGSTHTRETPAQAEQPQPSHTAERTAQAAKQIGGKAKMQDKGGDPRLAVGGIQEMTELYITLEDTLKMFDQTTKSQICIISEGDNVDYIKKAISIFAKEYENQIHVIDTIRDISDKNQLKTLFDFFVRVDHNTPVFVVWDPDCDKYKSLSATNNTYPIVLTRNAKNTVCKSAGIESLFADDHFDESELITIMTGSRTMYKSFDSKKKHDFKLRMLRNADAKSFDLLKDLIGRMVSVVGEKSNEQAAGKTARRDRTPAIHSPSADPRPPATMRVRPQPSGRGGIGNAANGAAGSVVNDSEIDAFLSYSHEVKDSVAEPLVRGLEERGITVWWDNAAMKISDPLHQKIKEGIGRARHGVVIVSRGYLDSDWGKTELGAMFGKGLQIFPILYGVSAEDAQKKLPAISATIMRTWGGSPESIMDEIARAVKDGQHGRTGQNNENIPAAQAPSHQGDGSHPEANAARSSDKMRRSGEDASVSAPGDIGDPESKRSTWTPSLPSSLSLRLDRDTYTPGSTIRATIEANRRFPCEKVGLSILDEDLAILAEKIKNTPAQAPSQPTPTTLAMDISPRGLEAGRVYTARVVCGTSAGEATFVVNHIPPIVQTDKSAYIMGDEIVITVTDMAPYTGRSKKEFIGNSKKSRLVIESPHGRIDGYRLRETGPLTRTFQGRVRCLGMRGDGTARGAVINGKYVDRTGGRGEEDGAIACGPNQQVHIRYASEAGEGTTAVLVREFDNDVKLDRPEYTCLDRVEICVVSPTLASDGKGRPATVGCDRRDCWLTVSTGEAALGGYRLVESEPGSGVFMGSVSLTGLASMEGRKNHAVLEHGRTGGTGPRDGMLACGPEDTLEVSFASEFGMTVNKRAPVRWHIGTIRFSKAGYMPGEEIKVSVTDPDMSLEDGKQNQFQIRVWSDSDRKGVLVAVSETSYDSGVFEGRFGISPDRSLVEGPTLKAKDGDTVGAVYTDETLPHPYAHNDSIAITAAATITTKRKLSSPLARLVIDNIRIVDKKMDGPTLVVGGDVEVKIQVKNPERELTFTAILQVSNLDGITDKILHQRLTAKLNGCITHAFSWSPNRPGTYVATVFLWKSMDNHVAYSPPVSREVHVLDPAAVRASIECEPDGRPPGGGEGGRYGAGPPPLGSEEDREGGTGGAFEGGRGR